MDATEYRDTSNHCESEIGQPRIYLAELGSARFASIARRSDSV